MILADWLQVFAFSWLASRNSTEVPAEYDCSESDQPGSQKDYCNHSDAHLAVSI
ncbi:hypothetical Protein YC6258_05054 [Gynuella sunshinyii YC6258]|uniref:Uncharacterized protein n=1 Tax=Gynuella sunshinyii YC6258 TaxID=1445510 RepID=A0A0C5W344_9GAMM|nr:hypothetical Protein YC6258_05054 [Gynuella sunshinyii YC6258]